MEISGRRDVSREGAVKARDLGGLDAEQYLQSAGVSPPVLRRLRHRMLR